MIVERVTGGVLPLPFPPRNTIPGTAWNQRKIIEKLDEIYPIF
jgi:hypothetical protein